MFVKYSSTLQCGFGWLRVTVGKTSIFDRRTFPVLRSTCSLWVTTYMYACKPSAVGQPTRPSQPFILPGQINEQQAAIRYAQPQSGEAPSGERLRGKGRHWKCRFSRWRISAILDFRDSIMRSLESSCTTSYRSSINTIALNCLVFLRKWRFFAFQRQTDRQTDKQMDIIDA